MNEINSQAVSFPAHQANGLSVRGSHSFWLRSEQTTLVGEDELRGSKQSKRAGADKVWTKTAVRSIQAEAESSSFLRSLSRKCHLSRRHSDDRD